MRRGEVALLFVTLAVAVGGCGGSSSGGSGGGSSSAAQDGFGDPYITEEQGRSVRIGERARRAFKALGGKADSGYNGQQAVPPLSYDYPVRGTGNPDDVNDTKTVWWQVCVKHGRVVGKLRGHLDSLPAQC